MFFLVVLTNPIRRVAKPGKTGFYDPPPLVYARFAQSSSLFHKMQMEFFLSEKRNREAMSIWKRFYIVSNHVSEFAIFRLCRAYTHLDFVVSLKNIFGFVQIPS